MTDGVPNNTIPRQDNDDAFAVMTNMTQDEGVLHDVLEELDRERKKRAELDAAVRRLTDELTVSQVSTVSRNTFLAMQAQVQGFQELVDALTMGKPAIAAAAAAASGSVGGGGGGSSSRSSVKYSAAASANQRKQLLLQQQQTQQQHQKTLPLHVTRLLEVMPWDPRAKEHIFGQADLYEWQVYDPREGKWQSHAKYFPANFQTLPVRRPVATPATTTTATTNATDRSLLVFLAGGNIGQNVSSAKQNVVLTNERLTAAYHVAAGYPLPQDGGTWEWIGGWRIEKDKTFSSSSTTTPTNTITNDHDNDDDDGDYSNPQADTLSTSFSDEEGWMYASDANDFINKTGLSNRFDGVGENVKTFRRRKWTRRRVLVEYPFCSESTRQFLAVLAENARLSLTVNKVSEQLVHTKTALTEKEEKLAAITAEVERDQAIIRALGVSVATNQLVGELPSSSDQVTNEEGSSKLPLQTFLAKNEQGVKEFGSKITQWVQSARKTSEDLTSIESNDDADSATVHSAPVESSSSVSANTNTATMTTSPQKFPWKKLGRGGLIEKLARPSPGTKQRSIAVRSSSSSSLIGSALTTTVAGDADAENVRTPQNEGIDPVREE